MGQGTSIIPGAPPPSGGLPLTTNLIAGDGAGDGADSGIDPANVVQDGSITTSGLTQNTARLLGRTTTGVGGPEEITVGAGLSLAAGVLTNTSTAPTAANPTATVGTAAVNGVSANFMRSDAAPAIDLTMSPTMTGTWTFARGSIATSQPVAITQTWNAAGITFKGLSITITNTASAAASRVIDLLVGATSVFGVSVSGNVYLAAGGEYLTTSGVTKIRSNNANDGTDVENFYGDGLRVLRPFLKTGSTSFFCWTNGTSISGTVDTALYRNSAGVVEINNGTAAAYRDLILRNITIGGASGTPVTLIRSATGVLDFGNTVAQTSTDLTIALTGAVLGDCVILGVPNAAVNANSDYTAWVSAADTVTVRFNNYSSGAIDPASATFRVSIIRF